MANNPIATATSGATAPDAELADPNTPVDASTTDVVTAETPDYQERNAVLRRRFLDCNLKLKQAREIGDTAAENAALREREAIGSEFIRANHGLAVAGARKVLIGATEDRNDHVQAALLGMWEALVGVDPNAVDDVLVDDDGQVRAAAGWDPSRGTFGTYSQPHIAGRARRSVRSTESAYTGMSYNAFGARPKILQARADLLTETGRTPTIREIAARAKVTEATVHTVLTAAPVSLDKPVGEDGDTTLGDLVADTTADLSSADVDELRDHLVAAAEEISTVDLMVMLVHTGAVIGRPGRSMVQTADRLGLGRGAVQLGYKRATSALQRTAAARTEQELALL